MTLDESDRWGGSHVGGLHAIPGTLHAPQAARRITSEVLRAEHPLLDDCQLVVSELVTNAVKHTRSGASNGLIGLTIEEPDEGRVRIEVIANGSFPDDPTWPASSSPHGGDESGRGLRLVMAFTHDWGIIHHNHGYHSVWALLGHAHG